MADRPSGRRGHLVLVGLPGAGKSTLGRLVAQRLGSSFLDLDAFIEGRVGRSIPEIFAEGGEGEFRALERRATELVAKMPPLVLAPGGGWVTQPELLALLRPPGRIIHLAVSPSAALARMGRNAARRPLLATADPLIALERLQEARAGAYAASDAVVDTEDVDLQQLVEQIAALAAAWGVGVG